jgi:hypothetical protein
VECLSEVISLGIVRKSLSSKEGRKAMLSSIADVARAYGMKDNPTLFRSREYILLALIKALPGINDEEIILGIGNMRSGKPYRIKYLFERLAKLSDRGLNVSSSIMRHLQWKGLRPLATEIEKDPLRTLDELAAALDMDVDQLEKQIQRLYEMADLEDPLAASTLEKYENGSIKRAGMNLEKKLEEEKKAKAKELASRRFQDEMDVLTVRSIANTLDSLDPGSQPDFFKEEIGTDGFGEFVTGEVLPLTYDALGIPRQERRITYDTGFGRAFHNKDSKEIEAHVDKAMECEKHAILLGKVLSERGGRVKNLPALKKAVRTVIALHEGASHGVMRADSNSKMPHSSGQIITRADEYAEGFAYLTTIEVIKRLRENEKDLSKMPYYDLLLDVARNLELMLPLYNVGEQDAEYRRQIDHIMELSMKSSLSDAYREMSGENVTDTEIVSEHLKPLADISSTQELVKAITEQVDMWGNKHPKSLVVRLAVTAAYSPDAFVREIADGMLIKLCQTHLERAEVLKSIDTIAKVLPG